MRHFATTTTGTILDMTPNVSVDDILDEMVIDRALRFEQERPVVQAMMDGMDRADFDYALERGF